MSIKTLLSDNTLDISCDSITATGNSTFGGTFGITGNTTVGGTLGVTGASTLTGNTTVGGTLGVTGISTFTGQTVHNGDCIIYNDGLASPQFLNIDRAATGTDMRVRFKSAGSTTVFMGLADATYFDWANSAGNILMRIHNSTAVKDNAVGGTAMYVDSNGTVGINTSLKAHKGEIKDLPNADFIYKLKPVSFKRKINKNGKIIDKLEKRVQYGFIADDVEKIDKNLCFYDANNKLQGLSEHSIYAGLVKCVKSLKKEVEILKKK